MQDLKIHWSNWTQDGGHPSRWLYFW